MALQVFLQHSIMCARKLMSDIKRNCFSSEGTKERCIVAIEHWLRYLNSAIYACGAYGLAAVDRAENYVYACLARGNGLIAAADQYLQREKWACSAATCYANALLRRCAGDSELEFTWEYVGHMYDVLANLQPGDHYESVVAIQEIENQPKMIADAHQFEAFALLGSDQAYVGLQAAKCCRMVAVYSRISYLYKRHGRLFSSNAPRSISRAGQTLSSHRIAVQYFETCMQYWIAVAAVTDPSLLQLWEAAARVMRTAAEHELAMRQVPGRRTSESAARIAQFAESIAPVVLSLNELSAALPVGLSVEWLEGTNTELVDIVQQILASPLVTNPSAANTGAADVLQVLVDKIAEKVRASQRDSSPDQRFIHQCQAECAKVDLASSPVHAPMAECWSQAARCMQQALDAPSASQWAASNVADLKAAVDALKCRSREYMQLATGTFTVAAEYYGRAERAVKPQAEQLWRQAAAMLQVSGINRMQRLAEGAPLVQVPLDVAQERCATRCAEAATCSERVEDRSNSTEMTLRLSIVDVSRAVVKRVELGVGPDSAHDTVCLWTTIWPRISDALLLLLQPVDRTAERFPPAHQLHVAEPSAGALHLRATLVEQYCAVMVELSSVYVEFLAPSDPVKSAMDAIEVACMHAEKVSTQAFNALQHTGPEAFMRVLRWCIRRRVLALRTAQVARAHIAGQSFNASLWARSAKVEEDSNFTLRGGAFCSLVANQLAQQAWALTAPVSSPLPTAMVVEGVHFVDAAFAGIAEAAVAACLAPCIRTQGHKWHKLAAIEYDKYFAEVVQVAVKAADSSEDCNLNSESMISAARIKRTADWYALAGNSWSQKGTLERNFMRAAEYSLLAQKYSKPKYADVQGILDKSAMRYAAAARATAEGDPARSDKWFALASWTLQLLEEGVNKKDGGREFRLSAKTYTPQAAASLDAKAAALMRAERKGVTVSAVAEGEHKDG